MRARAVEAAYRLIVATGLPRWRRRRSSGAAIFGFHNVVPDAMSGRVGDRSLHVGVTAFNRYIEWISRAYVVIPILELANRLRRRQPVGGLAVLTFDDGYVGSIRHALPVMRAAGVPFTVFPVVNGAADPHAFWWDAVVNLNLRDRERFLLEFQGDGARILESANMSAVAVPDVLLPASWQMLRDVLGSDITIGSHTVTHRNLATLPPHELSHELSASRIVLKRELGVDADAIAYPYGRSSDAVHAAAAAAGYVAGVTVEFGLNGSASAPLALARVSVPAQLPASTLACWGAGIRLRS